MKQQMKRKRA